jgi:paraquat-inducible protein A
MISKTLIGCPDCDLVQQLPMLGPGDSARCCRCGKLLLRSRPDSIDRTLALALAAAFVFLVANFVPLLGLSAAGREASTTILGGVQVMWKEGRPLVSLAVLFTAVVAPALDILFMLSVLLAAQRSQAPYWAGALLRYAGIFRPWRMVEVMLLGILVALTKIAELARVIPGTALWAVGALMVLLTAMTGSFDPQAVWRRVEWARPDARPDKASERAAL